MNYSKIYNSIIQNRINKPLNNMFTELHHIIPKSLGGSDEKDNLVRLTFREHYICHLLLSKVYKIGTIKWFKMNKAITAMKMSSRKNKRKLYMNNRLYNNIKKKYIQERNKKFENNKLKELNEICNWMDENNGKIPSEHSQYKIEYKLGEKLQRIKQSQKTNNKSLWCKSYKELVNKRGYCDLLIIKNIEDDGINKIHEICNWMDENNGKIPSTISKCDIEKELGRKLSCFKSAKTGNKNWKWCNTYEKIANERNYNTLFYTLEDKAKMKIMGLCDFIDKNKRLPNNNKTEKKLFTFYKNMISSYNGIKTTSKWYNIYETILRERKYFYLISKEHKGKNFVKMFNSHI